MQAQPSRPPFPPISGICRTDSPARAAYAEGAGIFRIVPEGVVVPSTTRALSTLVTWAAANRVPLVPRGAGSGMTGGNLGAGVVVDLGVFDGAPLTVHAGARRAIAGSAVRPGCGCCVRSAASGAQPAHRWRPERGAGLGTLSSTFAPEAA